MKKLEQIIEKLNFKKALKIYVSISVILLVLCGLSGVYVMRDKIKMAIDYKTVEHSFHEHGFNSELKTRIKEMAVDSKDVVNVIVQNNYNNIIYKVNNKIVGTNDKISFKPYEFNSRYIKDNLNKNIIYKIARDRNIIINKDYISDNEKINSDIDDDLPYDTAFSNKTIRLLNYVTNKDGSKLFVIRKTGSIPYAEGILKSIGVIVGIIILIYWIGLALWVYRDANRRKEKAALWALLTLVTNIIGLIIYTMFKQTNNLCYKCGAIQSRKNVFCTVCGTQINKKCNKCGNIVEKKDSYCSGCGNKL